MEYVLAKTAGFCFGVARAMDIVFQSAEESGGKFHTLGPIIHNPQVVDELARKGNLGSSSTKYPLFRRKADIFFAFCNYS